MSVVESDAALVNCCLAGRREAFAELVRRHQDAAYALAASRVPDLDLARDIVQEAFLVAWRDLGTLREPERFAPFLLGIVRHTASRTRRELGTSRQALGAVARDQEPAARPLEGWGHDARQRALLQRALGRLSAPAREVLVLHYVSRRSYAQIAGILGISETAVQGRLQRALAALRKDWPMVENALQHNALPDDFAARIQQMLAATKGHPRPAPAAVAQIAALGPAAAEPLLEALESPASTFLVRRAAAFALCQLKDPRAIRPILQLIHAPAAWQYYHLFLKGAVLEIPGFREALLERLPQAGADEAYWLMAALEHRKDEPPVHAALLGVFRDAKRPADLRCDALQRAVTLGSPEHLALVIEALREPGLNAGEKLFWRACSHRLVLPLELLLPYLAGTHLPNTRIQAADLILLHGEAGRKALESVLATATPDRQASAALGLARFGDAKAFEVLANELRQPRAAKWHQLVSKVLAGRYPQQLAALAADPATARSPNVAWTLADAKAPPPAGDLETLLATGSPSVRAAALRALVKQQGAAMLPRLREILRAQAPAKVAREAFNLAARMGPEAAGAAAEDMLVSEHWQERRAGHALLRRWGRWTEAHRAQARGDAHPGVRASCDAPGERG